MLFKKSLPRRIHISITRINILKAFRERIVCSEQQTNHKHSTREKNGIFYWYISWYLVRCVFKGCLELKL